MKHKIVSRLYIICLITSIFFLSSCVNNFLDNPDKSVLTDATQWSNEATADLFLNDIYNNLPDCNNSPDNMDNFTDYAAQHFYYTSYNWKQGIVNPSATDFGPWGGVGGPLGLGVYNFSYASTYANIRKCNTFIDEVRKHAQNFSQTWMNKRIDEARFLRAFFYSKLWELLGGVPIITHELDRHTMDSSQLYVPRSSFAQTFNFIVSQLDSIINDNYLAVKYGPTDADAGRATIGAALMLKGWVQLYAASPAFNAPVPAVGSNPDSVCGFGNYDKNRWAAAAATFKQFIDNYGNGHPYDLFPDLSSHGLWFPGNKYNSEVIWDRQYVANTPLGSTFEQYGGPVYILGAYYTWGNYNPTQELVDRFYMANGKPITDPTSGYDPQHPYENREPRFYDWIVYDGAPYYMDWMPRPDTIYTRIDKVHPSLNEINFSTGDVSNTGYYFKKRLNPLVRPGGGPVSGSNYIYFRYAEVLLGYAEAENEAYGPDQTVYNAVNAIRRRAGIPDLQPGLSQDQMRQEIHQERDVELCFENKRFYDIIRWKIADSVLNRPQHGMMITNSSPNDDKGAWQYTVIPINYPPKHEFDPKMYLAPIPQSVIDQNPRIIQNPGY